MNLISVIRSVIKEQVVTPPDIPDSQTFWHGGNIDNVYDDINYAKGRYEYGPGLYLTTSYELAKDYAKGTRKLYMVTVQNGNDLADSSISKQSAYEFMSAYVIGSKKKYVKEQFDKWTRSDGTISANIFLNILLNESAVKPSNAHQIRKFLVKSGIDYHITGNIRFNGKMMILFNMKKILHIQRIMPKDTIEKFDLHT